MVTTLQGEDPTVVMETALSKLLMAATMMADDMERGLAIRGLTRTRATVLWEIGLREPITQRELSDVLNVTPRNVTTLVDALEITGFATRADHPHDRRATIVALTSKGRKAVSRMKADKLAFAIELFSDLGVSDLRQFVGVLDHVIGRLDKALSVQAVESR